jgi:uncharacterized protein YndB with AHSA1/START domain
VTTTARPLVVREAATMKAPVDAVWEVLTSMRAIAEWDELPDEWEGERLRLGSALRWNRVDGGWTTLTVVAFEPGARLRLALYGSTWPRPRSAYDIGYEYSLSAVAGGTRLDVEIGDFDELPHGEDFHAAALDFASRAVRKIRELAEDPTGQRPRLVDTEPSAE